ncbi:glycosyltransferase family 2 protein [Hymenobacter taeanensis]|uniref:Glycosyltransferase family 2 protein n=1 Tax=Hymenobacter taeanensis TaxID=2735321 RepID=A0A6M6BIN9_9BACT|nr:MULTISPECIES: glycosyltransferase family A protein [Hymenobacter]QJX47654.1 glycosyltransferase family 2 protein [Hymenobacter taeanensis]UOQ82864.1 glycosyltransferase family 2 protein [Hymenobacter sp. 5414T-23]
MSLTPLVSIITCFLNQEAFLEEMINSVLSQSYINWQLLLVNDGSSDNSKSIATKYTQLFPDKIIYLEHNQGINRGLSASRNLAISQAKGELITFLDGDDVWLNEYLINQVKVLQENPEACMICEASEYWHSWHSTTSDIIIPVGSPQNTLFQPPQLGELLYPLGKGAAPCVCGIIVKRETLLRIGMFDEAFSGMYEDQVFLMKIYLSEPVFISSACFNRYRQRADSLVHASHAQGQYQAIRKRYLTWLEQYLSQQTYRYLTIELLLQQALYSTKPPYLSAISLLRQALSKIARIMHL